PLMAWDQNVVSIATFAGLSVVSDALKPTCEGIKRNWGQSPGQPDAVALTPPHPLLPHPLGVRLSSSTRLTRGQTRSGRAKRRCGDRNVMAVLLFAQGPPTHLGSARATARTVR